MVKSYDIAQFNPSDGLTPIQTKKLNENFQRLLSLTSGREENQDQVNKIAGQVQDQIFPSIMNAIYPIGSLVFAQDVSHCPNWGKWREVTGGNGRFVKLGGDYGQTGGSGTQTIQVSMPEHAHTYVKQVADKKIKVEESSASSAKEVLQSIKDSSTTTPTGSAGDGQDQRITIDPPYFRLKLFERYE